MRSDPIFDPKEIIQMKQVMMAMVTVLSLLSATLPASAQLPRKPAPQGMAQITADGVNGRILTSRMGGTASAHKMLQALKMVSGEYFDKSFTVTRAFADDDDQNLQAAFTARLKGVPVRGVASVQMQGNSGQGTLLFDNAKTFSKSFRGLTARQNGGGGGQKASTVKLTPQAVPDGSGQISLPPGFRITGAYKGTLDIAGPNGAAMVVGAPTLCTSYQGGAMFPGIPPVNFNDPVRAMLDYVNYMAQKSKTPINVKILSTSRVPDWPTGNAAYIRYSLQAAGKSMEGFGLFSIAATDVNQALLYQSYISAPTANYRSQFPGMLRAWGTWSVNPSVFQERLLAAAASMRGMSDIITSSNANTQQAYARVNDAWSDYIRDQGTWSNPSDGNQYKVSNTLTNGGGIPMVNGVALQPVSVSGL